MSDDIVIGESVVRYEPDTGFIFVAQVGTFDEATAPLLLEAVRRFTKPNTPTFLIADGRRGTGISSEARKIFTQSDAMGERLYLAVYGASFAFRVIVNLVFKAVSFTSSDQLIAVMVSDEAEARAWLTKKKSGR